MLFLTNSSMTKGSPLYWKAKTIARVCQSSKDAETLNMATIIEDAIYIARQVEILLFGDYKRRMKVKLFTDSEATVESIASSQQIDRKTLQMTVVDLKERLVDGEVFSYSCLPTEKIWADVMKKGIWVLRFA